MLACPECGHEWSPEAGAKVRDGLGNLLADGDTVAVIKDLKIKGSSSVIKVGTIRLIAGDDEIYCKLPGFGEISLK
ncbi:alkylphosphonate utilization protein [Albidovulum sediminis]|uniref:alkylphosphonate utilization protein n=1 Tax=Albidovulum sediminis TaxID=3066345 RepID=UPI00271535D8|nr:alkylphosphonate utilization protein [Defluviimonas sediminis]